MHALHMGHSWKGSWLLASWLFCFSWGGRYKQFAPSSQLSGAVTERCLLVSLQSPGSAHGSQGNYWRVLSPVRCAESLQVACRSSHALSVLPTGTAVQCLWFSLQSLDPAHWSHSPDLQTQWATPAATPASETGKEGADMEPVQLFLVKGKVLPLRDQNLNCDGQPGFGTEPSTSSLCPFREL